MRGLAVGQFAELEVSFRPLILTPDSPRPLTHLSPQLGLLIPVGGQSVAPRSLLVGLVVSMHQEHARCAYKRCLCVSAFVAVKLRQGLTPYAACSPFHADIDLRASEAAKSGRSAACLT